MRVILLFLIMFVFGLGAPHKSAHAQNAELTVRGGIHDGYGRLVFDWPSASSYTTSRPDKTTLRIDFAKNASLDKNALSALDITNVSGINVVSQSPLSLTLTIPEQSETRDMTIGSRVIVDIYNPPGGAVKTDVKADGAAQGEEPKPEPENEEPQAENPPLNTQDAQTPKAEPEPQSEPETETETETPAPPVSEPENEATPPEEQTANEARTAEPDPVKLRPSAQPVTILMSSTQSIGAAAFELGGKLYFANDKSDLLIQPQISGANKEAFQPVNTLSPDVGKVFEMPLPTGNIVKGQGGGLVWRLRISPDLEATPPIEPVRVDITRDEARSGKILWPFENARTVLTLDNPLGGVPLKIVTVEKAEQASVLPRSFVDFDVLPSPIGLTIVPKVDDLEVSITPKGVEISRPQGLSITEQSLIDGANTTKNFAQVDPDKTSQRLFDFENWQLGTAAAVDDNRMILLEGLKDLSEGGRTESLMTLAKMYISHGLGPEATGALRFAQSQTPSLSDSPEFKALRGVAEILSYQNEYGFDDLSDEGLKDFEETGYWRTAALAGIGDWQQAESELPRRIGFVANYPQAIENRLVPLLAETALRAGDVKLGNEFLALIEDNTDLNESQQAAIRYLKGEAARQKGDVKTTKELWEPLTEGPDDLYRAKAGLALTRLLVDEGELSPGKAIDRLERLRYAWRGDDLEAQINMWLGRTYFESGDFIKGLQIMREATTFVPGTQLAARIAEEMGDAFTNLYTSSALDSVSPLDAVALYNEFIELVPVDERGDQVIESLAEHLVKANLLTRAGNLLDYLLQHRLQGEHAYRVATRLAAIRLLDNEPAKAMTALKKAEDVFGALPEEMQTKSRSEALALLKARALSKQGRPDQALAMLRDMEQTTDVNRLRSDIAWQAAYWDDAAEALEDVILDENISLTRPLSDEHTALLMRRAIALNLSSDRIALANLREKYTDVMNQTDKAKIFEVITRPRKSAALADRDTLMNIVTETDLFSDFLETYKTMQNPVN